LADTEKKYKYEVDFEIDHDLEWEQTKLIDRDTKILIFCMIVAIVIGAIAGKILAMIYI
jgi:hypothetical protein